MAEMHQRGYKPAPAWLEPDYRGRKCKKLQGGVCLDKAPEFREFSESALVRDGIRLHKWIVANQPKLGEGAMGRISLIA